jgi:amino acid adenylation domain-containing protein/non-ribosomal peptide synthase protein (TIGR01720 family)
MNALVIESFLADLARQGVRLSLRGEQLHCEAPRGAVTPALRDTLSVHKGAIVSFLRDRDAPTAASASGSTLPIGCVARSEPIPLSYSQQRLWLQSQMDSADASYNIAVALRVRGELHATALQGALEEVVRRHEPLRTGFAVHAGQPVQLICSEVAVPLVKHDLTDHPESQRQDLEDFMAREALQPFDLASAPLVRASLVRIGLFEHVLLITMHHLVSDGQSLQILVDEMTAIYEATLQQRAAPLPVLPVQYADFTVWERNKLSDAKLTSLRSYWVNELTGAPPVLNLPTDRPRTLARGVDRGSERFTLPSGLVTDLRALGSRSGTTLFMTLLAGFATLLSRYTNQTDIVVGSPISTRDHPDLENLVGMFINTLALRVRLEDNPTFAALLAQVRKTAAAAYAHKELPFEYVVEALRPERVVGRHPVFQVMFLSQNAPASVGETAGLRFEVMEHERFAPQQFDLVLMMTETAGGVQGDWQFRRDLFDTITLRRATDHLIGILSAMTADCEQRVQSVPLLTAAERRQILDEWNETCAPYPNLCFHQLFEIQVRRTPDACAVRCGEAHLTYRELSLRARRIARYLSEIGAARGAYVAVLLPRSIDLLASLIAVLQTGAAYIPLDPTNPTERIRYMLDDARPTVILTKEAVSAILTGRSERIIELDREAHALAAPVADSGADLVTLNDTAYVLYTSGSTGRPKGAIITHRGLSNYLSWCAGSYAVTDKTASAVTTSIGFDATVTSLFLPLLVGGNVVLLPEGTEESEALAAFIQYEPRPILAKITPAHIDLLRALAPAPAKSEWPRSFVIGGEQLLGEHVAWCRAAAPEGRIFNEYGPTETVVGCCVYEVPQSPLLADTIPIGRPIANTQLYIVNDQLEPVPVGVAGELCIGGAGLARGYLNRPELTSEKFVQNPFSADPLARLYKTGDRASYLPDGTLRFHGRLDAQVKIRGFRIELGEIEAVLVQSGRVHQAAVIVKTVVARSAFLVAYIVPTDSYAGEAALREEISLQLPAYMTPEHFICLESLPLSANGKVDRGALPAFLPESSSPSESAEPQTELERTLAGLWAEILDRPAVAVTDNFFRLGGDSILGIQLVARARQCGIQMAPNQLVEHPTIRELAKVVASKLDALPAQGPFVGKFSLTPIQRWFFALELPDPHYWNQSLMLTIPSDCDVGALEQALLAVVNHHDLLRARFPLQQVGREAEVAPPLARVDLPVVDLSSVPAEARQSAIEEVAAQIQGVLSLSEGLLFVPTLIRLGADEPGRLLLTVHHLVVDGVSWRILLEDLIRGYGHAAAHQKIALAPRTTSFGAWSAKLHEYARSQDVTSQRAYWLEVASQRSMQLAVDFPCTPQANLVASARVVSETLSAQDTAQLVYEVPGVVDVTVEELLLAALMMAVAAGSDNNEFTVDLENHGRQDLGGLDVSRTVGWFTTVFPVSFPLNRDADRRATLAAVKQRLRAVPAHGVGYGLLRYLSADEELCARIATLPQPQIRFNYFGQLDRSRPHDRRWALASESCGLQRSPSQERLYLLEVDASVLDGHLVVHWAYSERLHHRETVERLARAHADALRLLASDCAYGDVAGGDPVELTPADIPDMEMSEDMLAHVLAEVARANSEP